MSTNYVRILDQLNAGDRVEVLMKKESDLQDRTGLFQRLQVIEDESVRLEFLVVEEETALEEEESYWFISMKFVDQVRKVHLN